MVFNRETGLFNREIKSIRVIEGGKILVKALRDRRKTKIMLNLK